jgi:hypothetical protein
VTPPVQHLRNRGYDATLLQPLAWRGVDQDLELYGRHLAAAVPFWIYFSVQPALQSLDAYLTEAEPYAEANVFLFEHGAESPGIATPEQFAAVLRRHGIAGHFQGLDRHRFPHDIGTLGRYGKV